MSSVWNACKEPPMEKEKEGYGLSLYEPTKSEYKDYLTTRLWKAEETLKGFNTILKDIKTNTANENPTVINILYTNKKGNLTTRFLTSATIKQYKEVLEWLMKQIKK